MLYNKNSKFFERMRMDTLADYEPLEYYTKVLRDAIEKNAADYFDELVKRAGVNAEENKATVARYNAASAKAEQAEKKLNSSKALRGFVIFLTVAAFLVGAILLLCYFTGEQNWVLLLVGILCLALGIVFIVLLCTKIKQTVRLRQEKHAKALATANAILQEAYEQMYPLHRLFTWNMTRELVLQTLPYLKLDEQFDVKRLDLFTRKYGFVQDADPDSSTVFVLSGEADGNPFFFERLFRRTMGTKTYHGSLVITWTTYTTDSDGNTRAVHHTQTLTASVTKPAPYYGYETRMYYGNEAAPDLRFSRQPTHAEQMDDKQLEKQVKRGGKQLAKKTRKAIGSGSGRFTEMASTEFEVLFGALDRTNEVQYRLMFTPLAQQNMLDLIKSDDGYGDDFAFYKAGCVNCIRSEHAQVWQTDTDPSRYKSYDLSVSRATFISFNAEYFKSLYFDLAPVLAVPLYRQTKPREFIYRDVYSSNYTGYEAEVLANRFDPMQFAHPATKTSTILKASFERKDGAADRVAVTAYSFDTIEQVDFVNVLGGDGNIHAVPVPWTEYIPVSRTSEMAMRAVGGTREGFEQTSAESSVASFVRRFSENGASAYCDGLMAFPLTSGWFDASADAELGDLFGLRAAAAAGATFLVGAEAVRAAAEKMEQADAKARAAQAEKAPAEEAPAEEAPAEETPAEEAPAEEAPAEGTPAEEAPAEEAPAEEAPAEEAPAEEAPAEETPAEETPAEEAPAEEAPADEAEKATAEGAEEAPSGQNTEKNQ